jgi:hypothetical protein
MSRFHGYAPDQAYLLPPNVKDVLGEKHLCFHLHGVVEKLDTAEFDEAYGAEGRLAYPPKNDAEGVVVCVRVGGEFDAATGAAHSRRPGVPLSGGRTGTRPQDAERVSAAAPAGDQ